MIAEKNLNRNNDRECRVDELMKHGLGSVRDDLLPNLRPSLRSPLLEYGVRDSYVRIRRAPIVSQDVPQA